MADIHPAGPQTGHGKDNLIPGVKYVIAVSSGKGGVGKSTVSVNLAVALALTGAKVGLLDADIYGPNIPMMMGVTKPPEQKDGKIVPAESHGVSLISMGFFVPEDTAVVWRGPMVHTAIQQLFRDVLWGELDYLLIDLPPGTGDAQLTLTQLVPLTGAVTVTTPQEVALHDVRKGIMMFQKVNVPLLGIVENMSYFLCGHCGARTDIFSHGEGSGLPLHSGCRSSVECRLTRRFVMAATRATRSSRPIQRLRNLRRSGRSHRKLSRKSPAVQREFRRSKAC